MTLSCRLCVAVATHIFIDEYNNILPVCFRCGAKKKGIILTKEEVRTIQNLQ